MKTKSTKSIARGLMCGVAFMALTPVISMAQDANKKQFDIDPQNLSGALTQFSIQSGVEVLFNGKDVKDKASQTLTGTMSPATALNVLLAETDVSYFQNADGTFIIGETYRSKIITDEPKLEKQVQLKNDSVDSSIAAPEDVEVKVEASLNEDVNIAEAFKEEASFEIDDEIVAIGTRIAGANDTQRVKVITFEDLEKTGVNNIEEAFRRVLQNFSSTNVFSNVGGIRRESGIALGPVADGVSSVNLRGLGSENTLVLVNGRRVAGVAGSVDNFTNISNIPLAAVERIEILSEGASAAYGSDAVGGVVNIVLRKDFSGLTLIGNYENSSTGADASRLSATYGTGWGSGRLTATASYNQRDPIIASDAGYTTNLYPGIFNDGSDLDGRLRTPRTGIFLGRSLPNDNDGTSFTFGDTVPAVTQFENIDLIPETIGADSEQISFTLDASQSLTDNIELFANGLYSETDTFNQSIIARTPQIPVPSSNAFNTLPFPFTVGVQYFPFQEFQDGLIDAPSFTTSRQQLNLTGGFNWDISKTASFELSGGYSRAEGRVVQQNVLRFDTPEAMAVLESSDPTVAVNLFGNGTAQNPEAVAALFGTSVTDSPVSELYTIAPTLKFDALKLGGGDVKWVIGGEYRRDSINDSGLLIGGQNGNSRDVTSLFGEVFLPFVSEDNTNFLMKKFSVSLQARYENYSTSGTFNVDPMDGNEIEASFDNISPRLGVAYSPLDGLIFRGSISEAFRAPTANDLFTNSTTSFNGFQVDPFSPTPGPGGGPAFVVIPITSQNANPDLRPETSTNTNFGLNYKPEQLEGLEFDVSWSRVKFTDRIANTLLLSFGLLPEELLSISGVAERDADGTLIGLNHQVLNTQSRISENIEAEVSYKFDTDDFGRFNLDAGFSYFLELSEQVSDELSIEDTIGTARGPDEYSIQGHIGWQLDNITLDAFARYSPSHINDINVMPGGPGGATIRRLIDVNSYTTFDLSGSYNFEDLDLRLSAGVRNLFNADFPLSPIGNVPYDAARIDPRGRVFNIGISKTF